MLMYTTFRTEIECDAMRMSAEKVVIHKTMGRAFTSRLNHALSLLARIQFRLPHGEITSQQPHNKKEEKVFRVQGAAFLTLAFFCICLVPFSH